MIDLHSELFDQHHARQDKIQIELGKWFLHGFSQAEAAEFARRLNEFRAPQNPFVPLPLIDDVIWFNRAQGFQNGRSSVKVRAAGDRPPLFSGVAQIRRVTQSGILSGNTFVLSFELTLNPTRYVRYRLPDRQPDGEYSPLSFLLLLKRASRVRSTERSLDQNDNVLLQRGNQTHIYETWHERIQEYYLLIHSLLDQMVTSAVIAIGILPGYVRWSPEVNLKSVETYWEVPIENAAGAVRAAEYELNAIGSRFHSRRYPHGENLTSVEIAAVSHQFRLSEGVKARVYAKTDQRVRFEIIHELTENAQVLGTAHTTSVVNRLLEWLPRIAEDASNRVQPVIEAFRTAMAPLEGQMSVVDFVLRARLILQTDTLTSDVIQELTTTGRLETRGSPSKKTVARLLAGGGLVERVSRRSTRFRPVSALRGALMTLRHTPHAEPSEPGFIPPLETNSASD